jgi:hypothetical protein
MCRSAAGRSALLFVVSTGGRVCERPDNEDEQYQGNQENSNSFDANRKLEIHDGVSF